MCLRAEVFIRREVKRLLTGVTFVLDLKTSATCMVLPSSQLDIGSPLVGLYCESQRVASVRAVNEGPSAGFRIVDLNTD